MNKFLTKSLKLFSKYHAHRYENHGSVNNNISGHLEIFSNFFFKFSSNNNESCVKMFCQDLNKRGRILEKYNIRCVFKYIFVIVNYVQRQSGRCLYEDAEFNGKTASEYEEFDCLGTYDIISETGKGKREFVCRGAKVKLRLILLHTCTCGVL